MDFLVGFILIATGVIILRYRFQIYHFVGEWDWANKYLGSTTNALAVVGCGLIFVGVAFPFGAFDGMKNQNVAPSQNTQTEQTTQNNPFQNARQ